VSIVERLEGAIGSQMTRLSEAEQKMISKQNETYDSLVKQGIVIPERYNVDTSASMRPPILR
jgi:hypothetical protein